MHQDSYLNELQQRANRLLRNSSDSDVDMDSKDTLVPIQFKPNKHSRRAHSQSSETDSVIQREKKYHKLKDAKSKNKGEGEHQKQINSLKAYVKELQVQNEILKNKNHDQRTKEKNQSKSIEEQMRRFKKEMKSKLEQKFSLEVQVWIKKLKKMQKQKQRVEEDKMILLQQKDDIIQSLMLEKRELKKKINKLNRFILRQVPEISAQTKANALLVESCIAKHYPVNQDK